MLVSCMFVAFPDIHCSRVDYEARDPSRHKQVQRFEYDHTSQNAHFDLEPRLGGWGGIRDRPVSRRAY